MKCNGIYVIRENGREVLRQSNLITDEGKNVIRDVHAGIRSTPVRALGLGVGSTAAVASNTDLEFAVVREDVTGSNSVRAQNNVIYKAMVPESVVGKFYEIGAWSAAADSFAPNTQSLLLASFDSQDEVWTGGSFVNTFARVGSNALILTSSSNTVSASTVDVSANLADYSDLDLFSLAYNRTSTVNTVTVRIGRDASNYFSYAFTPGTNYNVKTWSKSQMTTVGTPDWSDIQYLYVASTSSGAAGSVHFDGLRIDDRDRAAGENVLVSRTVLVTPFTKTFGVPAEIEYGLSVTV